MTPKQEKQRAELLAKAEEHERNAHECREEAARIKHRALASTPVADRLVYAATARCPCGAGLAYDPTAEDPESPFKGALSGWWDCSDIILGLALEHGQPNAVEHTGRLPFSFYEIKSEWQPSAHGATTREPLVGSPSAALRRKPE